MPSLSTFVLFAAFTSDNHLAVARSAKHSKRHHDDAATKKHHHLHKETNYFEYQTRRTTLEEDLITPQDVVSMELAHIAYHRGNAFERDERLTKWIETNQGNLLDLNSHDNRVATEFQGQPHWFLMDLKMKSNGKRTLILVWRGSTVPFKHGDNSLVSSFRDWLGTNLDMRAVCPFCEYDMERGSFPMVKTTRGPRMKKPKWLFGNSKCKACAFYHNGFFERATGGQLLLEALQYMKDVREENDGEEVDLILTGHSMGGAAALVATSILNRGFDLVKFHRRKFGFMLRRHVGRGKRSGWEDRGKGRKPGRDRLRDRLNSSFDSSSEVEQIEDFVLGYPEEDDDFDDEDDLNENENDDEDDEESQPLIKKSAKGLTCKDSHNAVTNSFRALAFGAPPVFFQRAHSESLNEKTAKIFVLGGDLVPRLASKKIFGEGLQSWLQWGKELLMDFLHLAPPGLKDLVNGLGNFISFKHSGRMRWIWLRPDMNNDGVHEQEPVELFNRAAYYGDKGGDHGERSYVPEELLLVKVPLNKMLPDHFPEGYVEAVREGLDG